MQTQVRDIYMRVIDTTIENARAEFQDNGVANTTLVHLETLKTRWRERLLASQDFTDDPLVMRGSAASSARAARAVRGEKRKAEDAGPASKRSRTTPSAEDDDEKYKDDSDLGSSSGDSDIQSAGSDPDVDNYILAQSDRVRKGGGKWKVQLKEGIAHINGRDYLFNRATCDLDW